MSHHPIILQQLGLSLPHKTCFENFNCQIPYSSRIGITGRNGTGKSTLIKMIAGVLEPSEGAITHKEDVVKAYVPQVIEDHANLSGGQRLNKVMTEALSLDPNVLLLDEPTNHLDSRHRKNLIRMLQNYHGTLIVASHDEDLIRDCTKILWYIDNAKIHIFSGNYNDYIREVSHHRSSIEQGLARIERQKKDMHHALMKEQIRAAKSKSKGEKNIHQRKWPTIVSTAKASRAEETSGQKKSTIHHKKQALTEQLSNLRLPEMIVPKFSLISAHLCDRTIVSISDGGVGYKKENPLIQKINISINSRDRIAIIGDNGSGKSTLIKAILGDDSIYRTGNWYVLKRQDMGYLDQHYKTLELNTSALETISNLVPHWTQADIRRHLNDFLFRKNEEVTTLTSSLSGGEKARLSLAHIAACTPKLLILDEITNNLDLETKNHVTQVLKAYPGAMIVISHDESFLKRIGVTRCLLIVDGTLKEC